MIATSSHLVYNKFREAMVTSKILCETNSPRFGGIAPEELELMLGCIGYHIGIFRKGDIVAFEEENIRHNGILITGSVDMIREDLWGNKTMLVRMHKDELFGETFACVDDNQSVVTFMVYEDAQILFLPFDRELGKMKVENLIDYDRNCFRIL